VRRRKWCGWDSSSLDEAKAAFRAARGLDAVSGKAAGAIFAKRLSGSGRTFWLA